jgi:glycosyltransferase involved in cell wall biosynthesis
MIRIAFPLIGRGGWTGGYSYLKNTLSLIATRLQDRVTATAILTPEEAEAHGAELAGLCGAPLIVDPLASAGRGASLARALLAGRDARFDRLLQAHQIDLVFEVAAFLGARSAVPVLSWIPDFQHQHMPQMFGRAGWWRREIGFRAQTASRKAIMVSSQTACNDLERFYPVARGRGQVVRFAAQVDVAACRAQEGRLRDTWALAGDYIYLPNQFWRHKNHAVVVEALALLKQNGGLDRVAPVIMSGNTHDPRNPGHFDAVMAKASEAGVESHFRHLGLIPFADVLGLAASARAVLNPSLFEGWSTPIEEAKALGAPMILSDIPIFREQAPDGRFFQSDSAASLAEALLAPGSPRQDPAALAAAQTTRLDAHASALLAAVAAATKDRT